MAEYGVIWEYGSELDLSPFPLIPAGAVWVGGMYLVAGVLHNYSNLGVNEVLVVSRAGSVYLTEAISAYDRYSELNVTYFSDVDDQGESETFARVLATAVHDTSYPVMLSPGHLVTDFDYSKLRSIHVQRKRASRSKLLVTLACVPGENKTVLDCPKGYTPIPVACVEPGILRLHSPGTGSLIELFKKAEEKRLLKYYEFDGVYYPCDSEEAITHLQPGD